MADSAVAARGDVEIPSTSSLEIGRRRPRLTTCAEGLELRLDAVARPAPLCPSYPGEAIARGPSVPDPFEDSGFDEVGEIVSSLGAAHAGELFVLPAREFGRRIGRQRSHCPLLRRLQLNWPNRGMRQETLSPTAHSELAPYRTFAELEATATDEHGVAPTDPFQNWRRIQEGLRRG
jgi:hypothetical protein